LYETIARKTTTLANIGRIRNESTPSHPQINTITPYTWTKRIAWRKRTKRFLFFQRTFVQTNQGHHFLEQRGAHGAGSGDKHHLQIMSVKK